MPSKHLSLPWVFIFGMIGLASAWVINYAMAWGPWAYSDSVAYVEVARNLVLGRGPVQIQGSGDVVPIRDRPPFYPMVLAFFTHQASGFLHTAQALNLVLYFLFIFGIAAGLYLLSRQPWLSLGVCFILIPALIMIKNFTGAMSEPLFYALGIASLFMLIYHLRKPTQLLLWISALCAGLAFLARYTGITFIGTGGLAILIFSHYPPRKRWGEAILYVLAGLAPFILWSLYLKWLGSYPGDYYIPSTSELVRLLRTLQTAFLKIPINWVPWFSGSLGTLPTRYQEMITTIGILVIVGLVLVLIAVKSKKGIQSLLADVEFQIGAVFAGFCVVYSLFIILTYLFVKDYKPSLDERMFSPLLMGGTIGLLAFLSFASKSWRPAILWRLLPAIVGLLFLSGYVGPTNSFIRDMHDNGLGLSSKSWQESSLLNAVNKLPANMHIISDNIDLIMLYTYRSASRIPELESQTRVPIDQVFGNDLANVVQKSFHDGHSVLVLFNDSYWQFDNLYGGAETKVRFQAFTQGLYEYYRGSDGAIYYYSAPN